MIWLWIIFINIFKFHLSLTLLLNTVSGTKLAIISLVSKNLLFKAFWAFIAPCTWSLWNLTQTFPGLFYSTQTFSTLPISEHTSDTYSLMSIKNAGSFFKSTWIGSNMLFSNKQFVGIVWTNWGTAG